MGDPIPITRPLMGEEEAEAARRPILKGWVAQGAEVAGFEAELQARLGAAHAVAVSSGTAALHLALVVGGVGAGDEVITVSLSYVASANAIRYCGASPVLVDVEPGTGFNVDVAAVEAAVGPRTRAILCVHQLGMPCNLRDLVRLSRDRGLLLVEDAACALGSGIDVGDGMVPVGRPHGDLACFSFHPRKVITTGDGGLVTTSDPELARRLRALRNHGMGVDAAARHAAAVASDDHDELGFNYRMTDIQAAVGRVQLGRLDRIVERRRALADRYRSLLSRLDVELPQEPGWARSNWQSFCVALPAGVDRDAVIEQMQRGGVATRRGVMCIHQQPAYPAGTWRSVGGLSRSEDARARGLMLPIYPGLEEAQQERVAQALGRALEACR